MTLDEANIIKFHRWWEPFKEYNDVKDLYAHDDFKSFPSGHTAEVSILFIPATFLPLAHDKFKKIQMPTFYCACGLVLLVALARILAAAHFLSDVSWGATIILTLLIIANEVVMRIKSLQLEESPKE